MQEPFPTSCPPASGARKEQPLAMAVPFANIGRALTDQTNGPSYHITRWPTRCSLEIIIQSHSVAALYSRQYFDVCFCVTFAKEKEIHNNDYCQARGGDPTNGSFASLGFSATDLHKFRLWIGGEKGFQIGKHLLYAS